MLHAALLAAALGGSTVAYSRCNNEVATHLEDQVRAFDGRPPSETRRDERFLALQLIIANADQEAGIVHAVCGEDEDVPIQAQLHAVQAWAFLLESDLNRGVYAARCPSAEKAVAQALVANAWLLVVKADPANSGRFSSIENVRPKVVSRASDVALKLPPPADTSAYWLSKLQRAGTEAISACPQ